MTGVQTCALPIRFDAARGIAMTLVDGGANVIRAIPSTWVYGTLAVVAGCYATLLGLGAATYKALTVNTHTS